MHQSNKLTPKLGDIGIIFAVGAILWIVSQQRQTAIVGAVTKDPCAGLTGATLAACRKAQPKSKPVGITPATPVKKTSPVYSGPSIKPRIPPGTIKPKDPLLLLADKIKKEDSECCDKVSNYVIKTYMLPRKSVNENEVYDRFRKTGCRDKAIKCGLDRAFNYAIRAGLTKTKFDTSKQRYQLGKPQAVAPGKDPYGLETTERPAIDTKTPLDHFVNGIASWLQQAWNNLSQGRTAIGGQPTVLTGSPSAPVVRPVITPIA